MLVACKQKKNSRFRLLTWCCKRTTSFKDVVYSCNDNDSVVVYCLQRIQCDDVRQASHLQASLSAGHVVSLIMCCRSHSCYLLPPPRVSWSLFARYDDISTF